MTVCAALAWNQHYLGFLQQVYLKAEWFIIVLRSISLHGRLLLRIVHHIKYLRMVKKRFSISILIIFNL